ncbi:MarR family winged helix-turn-helix transcriptional regulator [Aureimonas phyllosphaerae]|uniref:MarR family winged helix-turn-helix transcriptional regulator n=1 Tax=Aureimonas phyllosphaerae TaxID=1166078 RepID=UPI003A5BD2DD
MEHATQQKAIHTSPLPHQQSANESETSLLNAAMSSAQALRALLGLKLAPLGLAAGQDRLLLALEEHGRTSVTILADVLNVRPSTVSKMLDRLAERSLTVRSGDDNDARRTNVELTDEGRALCRKLRVLFENLEVDLQSDATDEEAKCMKEGAALLNEAVGRRLRRLR